MCPAVDSHYGEHEPLQPDLDEAHQALGTLAFADDAAALELRPLHDEEVEHAARRGCRAEEEEELDGVSLCIKRW